MPPAIPVTTPPVAAPFIPPASAIVIWALPTKFEVIRCVAWEEGESKWRFAVVFGTDLLKTELVPDLETLWGAADMLWRYLAPHPIP